MRLDRGLVRAQAVDPFLGFDKKRLHEPCEKSVFGSMADKNRKIIGHDAKPDCPGLNYARLRHVGVVIRNWTQARFPRRPQQA
jgi:hypothetical protein